MAQDSLCETLCELGFKVAEKKQIPPSTCVKFLGIIVNTEDMTLSVGQDKLERVTKEIHSIQGVHKCKRKRLEQLAETVKVLLGWT